MSTETVKIDQTEPEKQHPLDKSVQQYVMAWIATTALVTVVINSHPSMRRSVDSDTKLSFQNSYQMGSLLLGSSVLFFLISRITSGLKQAIANAMMWTTIIPGFTMAFIVPNRYTMSFLDMNGRPVDVAHYVEAIFGTSVLLEIMGHYTQSRVSKTIKWNAAVFVFGFLSIISTEPVSTLCAWLSTMCYSVFLIDVHNMHKNAIHMSPIASFVAKWISFITNTLIAVMWFLNRFEMVTYPDFVLGDHFLQFCAKAVYGLFVLLAIRG